MVDKFAVQHWQEFGKPHFGNTKVVACDASIAADTTAAPYPDLVPVAGAIVDEDEHWWAWRAEVPRRHARRAGAWAECLTLFLALRYCRPGALVLADHNAAIDLAREALRGKGARWRRIESTFGRLPDVRRAPTEVRYYNGHLLHHRADRISRAVRVGGGTRPAVLAKCQEYAMGAGS